MQDLYFGITPKYLIVYFLLESKQSLTSARKGSGHEFIIISIDMSFHVEN